MNAAVIASRMRLVWSRCEQTLTKRSRRRLARDLHDGLTQDIYATYLALSVLRDRLPAEFRPEVERLVDRQVTMITSARELVNRTESPLDTMALPDLVDHLGDITLRELGAEPSVKVEVYAPGTVPARLARHAGFALREMISNAVRHSQGSRIEVAVEITGASLVLEVRDDGPGVAPDAVAGRGLNNLTSRAHACDGRFDLMSDMKDGTIARWDVPLAPARWNDDRFVSAA
jgi:signal transduction histidine kinase